ncbi:hypothetical protein BDV26DRAFT_285759 [Aspergillus bertholletiae]|uniref:Acetoacetate decarboxylase n=1 Tax=Aspergillus bertholletiae TaxID=1226010 RepID=A0A5N7AUI3_9EURO|nr:hypothetical protein BDV26DRAFT_285759 [Aspergillus bertholletiae]
MSTTIIPKRPSPWKDLHGDIFMCFAWPPQSKKPPTASYHDLEANVSFSDQIYSGGIQACIIVHYYDSPVGPYDELLWIPGRFELAKSEGEKTYRATRVYVSSKGSVFNGRNNWNVPKALAKFEFTGPKMGHLPYSCITISSYCGKEPFLRLNLEPMFFKSRPFLPLDTKYIPISFKFDFPPLPESSNMRVDARIGTSGWQSVHVRISGRAGLVKACGTMGDGFHFPKLEQRHWFWMKNAVIWIEGSSDNV